MLYIMRKMHIATERRKICVLRESIYEGVCVCVHVCRREGRCFYRRKVSMLYNYVEDEDVCIVTERRKVYV